MAATGSPTPATPGPAPGAAAPTQPATSAPKPSGRPPKKGVLLAVAAIAVGAMVVLALLVTGVLPGLGQGSKASSGRDLPYSAARPLADAAAAATPGGPWNFQNGVAVDARGVIPFGIGFGRIAVAGSTIHYLTSLRPYVPEFNGSMSSGYSPWWCFLFSNGTTDARGNAILLTVVVVNGTATAMATSSSPAYYGVLPTPPGAPTMDSPAVLAAAVTANSSYLSAHPGLNVSFGLGYRNNPIGVGWFWGVDFTTCGWSGQSGGSGYYNGTFLFVEVNDTSGTFPPGPPPAPIELPCPR